MRLVTPKKGYKSVPWLFGKEIEIPEEWNIKKIKDITKVSVGLVINPSTYFDDDGMVPMITGKNVTENGIVLDNVDFITEKSNKLLETTRIWSGDLVTMRVGYPGRTSVVKNEHDGINCASVIITRRSKKFVSEFLGYLANSKLMSKQIIMHQAGGAQQVVNIGSWKEFLIPFPSINEQQKIASMLSNVDSLINQTQKEIEHTQRLKKGLMQKLLTRGIGHTKFKKVKSLFGKYEEIPEEWNCFKLNQVCKKISVGIATSTTKYFVDKGVPLLRNQNIKRGYIDTSDLIYISEEFARMNESKKLLQGDVVSMRTGYPGQSAVVTKIMEGWQTFTTLIFRPNHEILSSHYLAVFLNSFGRKQITSSQAGAAQQNLNAGWASNLLILFPPILEQQKIASILSNIDAQINSQTQYKDKLERLKKSLMQKLLTGEVRV